MTLTVSIPKDKKPELGVELLMGKGPLKAIIKKARVDEGGVTIVAHDPRHVPFSGFVPQGNLTATLSKGDWLADDGNQQCWGM